MSFFEFLDQNGGFYYEVIFLSSPTAGVSLDDSTINTALGRCTGALHRRCAIFAAQLHSFL